MKIDSVASYSALKGVQRGMARLDNAANNIAQANTTQPNAGVSDVAENLVEANQAVHAVKASLKMVQTENQMLGGLLDIRI